jgi:hypothetical protein
MCLVDAFVYRTSLHQVYLNIKNFVHKVELKAIISLNSAQNIQKNKEILYREFSSQGFS